MLAFTALPFTIPPRHTKGTSACAHHPRRPPTSTDRVPSIPTDASPSNSSASPRASDIPTPALSSSTSASVLDELAPSLKFNAVVEAVARKRDHISTLRLLSEMRVAGIALEPTTRVTVFDAAVDDHLHLARLLALHEPPGYGSVSAEPRAPCAPVDPARTLDMSIAAAFLGVVGSALSAELVEPLVLHRPPDEPTALLVFLLGALAIDRYVAAAALWRRIRGGLTRLLTQDVRRSSRVDAASFLVAYLLGLPWICFRPDGKRALRWCRQLLQPDVVRASSTQRRQKASIDDPVVDRCLLWLVSGVAAEVDIDGMLIQSDMRPARDFMFGVRLTKPISKRFSVSEGENRVRMAVSGVSSLLQNHAAIHNELTDVLLTGASVGECVSFLSNRLSS